MSGLTILSRLKVGGEGEKEGGAIILVEDTLDKGTLLTVTARDSNSFPGYPTNNALLINFLVS